MVPKYIDTRSSPSVMSCPVAAAAPAALSDPLLEGPIVCVVSGGNIDLAKFAELVAD